MKETPRSLILASGSPRRKELLAHIGVPFHIRPVDIVEESIPGDPRLTVETLAREKALAQMGAGELVLASDTVVALEGKIFGKPRDKSEAKSMLQELAGKTHQVFTGVFLGEEGRGNSLVCVSAVTFDNIDEQTLNQYLQTGESLDKAGAYGIQGAALTFISRVEGSYSNVVGLPLSHVMHMLQEHLGMSWRTRLGA